MPLLPTGASFCRANCTVMRQMRIRALSYLHTGERVRGLRRDPASYLANPYGLKYGSVDKDSYQDRIKSLLHLKELGIELEDSLILQCLTHKSFAHGIVPYNEKLNVLGTQYLKFKLACFSVDPNNAEPSKSGNSVSLVNGRNFDRLGSKWSRNLISDGLIYKFIKKSGLRKLIFWKMRNPDASYMENGEPKILSTALNSLLGAMLITNGPGKTDRFINDFLLNSKEQLSLISLKKEKT
ncbi:mitochondrial 54S ribosomal protein mL57 KNAG_0J02770 [Huiozyma naganishii CBS 8797]|uniref:RNase III domain-containing protein n=1 Tax=Huiozyma naganishii (strain ATCC MYA-139 / BCRC 22969 / CBS 8797 / KCTC 17520 / NBRC 10181 / NCYC 3082 / Yp74L-3) TaxID=1071383 RepID=J7SAP5_HUIN7|nr:hypothetical protein KNAG_0J02770 [Kazachstania naganishii CBS 8797]CCK72356.1 hypothetical protein KNAG_0J02770 [Kazachstania naganishii CBS 8797]